VEPLQQPSPPSPQENHPTVKWAQENEILTALIEASPLAIYSIDCNARVTSWNRASEKIFGWKASEVMGKPLPIVPSHWLEQFHDLFAMLLRGQRFTDLELRRLRKDRIEIDISLSTAPLHGPEGRIIGVLGIASDISSRKRAEESLRDSERRYRSLFEENRAVMLLVDPNREMIIDANRTAYAYYGYAPDSFPGMSISRIETLHPMDLRLELDRVTHQGNDHFFTKHRLADGSLRDVEVHSTPLKMAGQNLLCAIIHDVTDKVQLEAQLRHSQKMEAMATLAGGIAHDFNNIISAMLGFAELIRMEIPSQSPVRPYVEEIRSAAIRARDPIGQILYISRDTEQAYHPIQVQVVIREALKLLRGALPSTIEIRQNISPTCGSILSDPVQIHQVFMNLCTNAYQAMPDGGVLEVTLDELEIPPEGPRSHSGHAPDLFACLTVCDTGDGMDVETKNRIFDPYFTTKEPKGGTGLGLAIVHGIVTNHHGSIKVDSTPGAGTTFKVFFPLCRVTETIQEGEHYSDLAIGHNEHIIYVDDEEPITKMRSILFEKIGYRVTACKSGQEALTILCMNPQEYDLVITDLTMPGMTGITLGTLIQSIRQGLPIILCTGQFTTVSDAELHTAGIRKVLQKPVEDELLAGTIREVLEEASGSRRTDIPRQ
jgi:PAS domain S-box-containing protein